MNEIKIGGIYRCDKCKPSASCITKVCAINSISFVQIELKVFCIWDNSLGKYVKFSMRTQSEYRCAVSTDDLHLIPIMEMLNL